MNENARQLSLTLDSIAGAVTEWSVSRLEELDATLPKRYGAGWRASWAAEVRLRVQQVAQSLAVRTPALLVDAAAWSRAAYTARGMPAADVDTSLESLRDVLQREVPEPVRTPAVEYMQRALDDGGTVPGPPGRAQLDADGLRYLESALTGDRRRAERLIFDVVEAGRPVLHVYANILAPAMTEIGLMWHREEITVAEEHVATRITESIMGALRTRFTPSAKRSGTVLTTTVGGDLHGVGIQMVADAFELDGWRSICLGPNTPIEDLLTAITTYEVDLLALSASSMLYVRAIGEAIDTLRQPPTDRVPVIVGGYPFQIAPDLWRELEAAGSAVTAPEAVTLANRLMQEA